MHEKVCPFCQEVISPYSDTIVGHDCYIEYEDEMEDDVKSNKEIHCT